MGPSPVGRGRGAIPVDRHASLYATAGYPAVTVPLGLRANGMPTGATLIGRFGWGEQLLGYAHAFEKASRRAQPT